MAVPENVFDALGAASIRGVKSTRAKHTEKVRCPKCEGGRTSELSLSVTIDDDGMGFAALCHRGSCQWKHGARIRHPASKAYKRPQASPPKLDILRPDWFYEFFSERRIGSRTVHHFGCYATKHYFNNSFGGDHPAIVFPYLFGGELVNRKYRPKGHKSPQAQETDAEPTLFNVDALGDAPEEIVWVEGEPDVMAMFECGIPHAVTLKDGAGKTVRAVPSEDDKRFEALRTHSDILAKAGRIILAGDHDVAGFAMREELARRLGRHRCYVVTWPDGCKDACDVLRAHGPDAVLQAVANAEPFPIDGLQRITEGTLAALWSRPAPKTMTTGTLASDRILKLPQEGRLIIVTGVPSHGKTSWTRFVMVHTATEHRRKWVVFSPEHQPWESFVAEVAEVYCGKPFYPNPVIERMSLEEIAGAERWLSDHVTMMVCDAEDEAPTLSWILERARASVLRDGSTDLLIDPWNEVEHQRGDMSETDYIGRCLQRLKAFGLRHGCNVWIIAHPAKPQILKHGEKRAAPGPYDLSGSAHWANKSDLGITLFSPENGVAEVHVWKTRFRRWGKRGSVATLEFDELNSRYRTPVAEMSGEPAVPSWMDDRD